MDRFEIHFNELPGSASVRTYVRSHVQEWLAHHPAPKCKGRIKIEFFKGPFEKKIGCYIEVAKGERVWTSFEYGRGVHDTFQNCLKHLSEDHLLERSS